MKKFLAAAILTGFLLSGCTPTTPAGKGTTQSAPVGQADLTVQNFTYSPSTLKVKPGATVTVLNRDIDSHTATSVQDGLFDTGLLGKDQTGSFTAPSEPGSYPFTCLPHPQIKGTLIVE